MMFQNYDYTQPIEKVDLYDGMKPYDGQHGAQEETDERYAAGIALGTPESADLRVVCLGFKGSGATSLMLKCAYNEYSDDNTENKLLQWDHHQFAYEYEDDRVRISISDLRGFDSAISKNEMSDIIHRALSYSNVILLLYPTDSRESFEGDFSVQHIKEQMDHALKIINERKIVLLLATKCDLEEFERVLTYEDGETLANKWEIPFFETSSKTGTNMKQILDQICDIYKYDAGGNYPLNIEHEAVVTNNNDDDDNILNKEEELKVVNNNNNNLFAEDAEDDTDFIAKEPLTFAPHCCCCGWLENCLLNFECCGCFCGSLFYIPFMLFLYILWLIQIPITLMMNLFAFLLCCNFCKCECCRGSLFIADDESVPDAHESVMLHTAESIRDLYLAPRDVDDHDLVPPDSPKDAQQEVPSAAAGINNTNNKKKNKLQQISILQWNIFGQFGRFWKRYPLLTTAINDMDPDILCLQEVITSKWWRFGTINTIKRINRKYRGFHVSAYNVLHDYNKLLFQYSCCWRTINECQSCCNLYCLLPFWRDKFWRYTLRSNVCCNVLFATFNGILAQIGDAIVFKNNYQLFRSYIPLVSGGNQRFALRALYILKDDENQNEFSYGQRLSITIQNKKKKKRKKVWIICTHLTKNNEIGAKQAQQIVNWMKEAQKEICKADAIVICGDFNADPQSNVYQIMTQNGYKSVVVNKSGKEQWTFPTETWRYKRGLNNKESDNLLIDDDENENEQRRTKDYIWIKARCFINIDKVKIIGRQYVDAQHKGNPVKIFPSDHLGIYCKISI